MILKLHNEGDHFLRVTLDSGWTFEMLPGETVTLIGRLIEVVEKEADHKPLDNNQ